MDIVSKDEKMLAIFPRMMIQFDFLSTCHLGEEQGAPETPTDCRTLPELKTPVKLKVSKVSGNNRHDNIHGRNEHFRTLLCYK